MRFSTLLAVPVVLAFVLAPAEPLSLGIDVTPVTRDSVPWIDVALTVPMRHDTLTVALPDEWAGESSLYRRVEALQADAPARLEPGADSAHRVLHSRAGTTARVTWRLRGVRTVVPTRGGHNHMAIAGEWAQLVGYDALVLPDRDPELPVRARFAFHGLARGAVVATSFGSGRAPADTLRIAHTALGTLRHAVYTFAVAPHALRLYTTGTPGHAVDVVVRDTLAMSDSTLSSVVQRVVRAERAYWNDAGPVHYLVTIGAASRGTLAGMRVANAFVADFDPTRRLDDGVTVLFAHELMHEWVGGTLHPVPSLDEGALKWFTEGFTEHLSHRVPWRAGLVGDTGYVAFVGRALREHATSAARDLPWDEVTRRYWTDPAAQRQPYLRGELLALRLDALVRARDPKRSLDDVLRTLATSDRGHAPLLTENVLVRAFGRVIGDSVVRAELRVVLDGGPMTLPDGALGSCVDARIERQAVWDPGFDVDGSLTARRVHGVRTGSAADRAGIRDGQVIAAANIYRGDVTKPIELRVRGDSGDRRISYSPASEALVPVQLLAWRVGCSGGAH